MRVIALSTLKAFWKENPEYRDAKEPTLAWYRHALHADWNSPARIKQEFGNASILNPSLTAVKSLKGTFAAFRPDFDQ